MVGRLNKYMGGRLNFSNEDIWGNGLLRKKQGILFLANYVVVKF